MIRSTPLSDLVVIGAGIVGASCAYYASARGMKVTLVDAGGIAGGTTSRGEGNILVSDKEPGPELVLALRSRDLWIELAEALGPRSLELERKGGLVVARTPEQLRALTLHAEVQAVSGVAAECVHSHDLPALEPCLTPRLRGGILYSQDMQVQPMLATAALVRAAIGNGARFVRDCAITGLELGPSGGVAAVELNGVRQPTRAVVNATGAAAGSVSALLGAPVPVLPRRGFVLVTEPMPQLIRHKVYSSDYVDNVSSDGAGLETSTVVESTLSGTVLIGASRERVGFDRSLSVEVLAKLADKAVDLFPFLAGVRVLRTYKGFRPYCPDHLPIIGEDDRVPGLYHACGHEGAGIGLAPATGLLISQLLSGEPPFMDVRAFAPSRFEEGRDERVGG